MMMPRHTLPLCLGWTLIALACEPPPTPETPLPEEEASLHSERGGIGVSIQGLSQTPLIPLDQRRSLAVTDTVILTNFTLSRVLGALAQQAGAGQIADMLFRQLWDTQNAAPGLIDGAARPHCSDNGGTLNGFPYPCRSSEGAQAGAPAVNNLSSYQAIGLFNRFDLAPVNGADCGEYRIVFGKTQGPGRAFLIFEAALPNPRPDLGLEGCRPVVDFWRDLSAEASPTARAARLDNFYFFGLPGFSPVVHLANYGAGARGVGQIRANMFIEPDWLLREFKTAQACPSCALQIVPVTVKTNPFGGLFSAASSDPRAAEFQTTFFPAQVAALATGDVNTFNYTVPDRFNAGGSDAQIFQSVDDYLLQFQGNAAFRATIQARLSAIGSPLTPENIVARAEALSCAGCHQRSNFADLGGFSFPASAGFVQSTEFQESGPDGNRFHISSALTGTFLPQRAAVMNAFLARTVDGAALVAASSPSLVSTAFSASITVRNTGTTVWTAADGFALKSPDSTWGTTTVGLAPGEAIAEGQTKTFVINASANNLGSFRFRWQMSHQGVFFGDASESQVTVVCNYAPPSLSAAFVNGVTQLSWNATPRAQSYNVYRASAATYGVLAGLFFGTTSPTSYTDPGLSHGQTYWYEVEAVSPGCPSLRSNTAYMCIPLSEPEACGSACGTTASDGCGGTIQCHECFDCGICECGCNVRETACRICRCSKAGCF
ncbi:MAG: hypothetical protein U1E65_11535 [Myxococcota bacterium]